MIKHVLLCSALLAIGACKKSEEPKPADKPAVTTEAPKAVESPKKAAEPAAPDPKLVERGQYIANAAGCLTCHTGMGPKGPDMANPGAGGLEMPDPAGTWRTPNITSDKASGIGSWTDAQIAAAIREGVRPDGAQLYAIMPYMNFNRMTDADVTALVAFLRSIKPVEKVVAPNGKDLKFPKLAMQKPANAPDVTGDPVKHGEYMSSIMLCNHCHWTPDAHMAPIADKMFAGGLDMTIPAFGTGKVYARNITSDQETGIGKWTEDQIFTTIKTMVKPDGKMISPPMMLLQRGWSQLDDKDLKAVAAYVHQLPAVKNKVPDSTFQMKMMGGPPPAAGSGAPDAAPPAPAPADKKPAGPTKKG